MTQPPALKTDPLSQIPTTSDLFAVCLLPCVAVLLRIALVLGGNTGTQVFPSAWIFRPAVIALAGTAVLVLLFRPFTRTWTASAIATGLFVLSSEFYEPIGHPVYGWSGGGVSLVLLASVFLALTAAGSVACARRVRPRFATVALAALFVSTAIATGSSLAQVSMVRRASAATPTNAPKRDSEPRLVRRSPAPPDVYVVIVDGLARADVLKDRFGVSAAPVLASLRRLGVMMPERARSNYTQTYLSLASTLNGRYIDPSIVVSPSVRDRRPLQELIDDAEIVRQFRAAGYEFVMIGSDVTMTSRHPLADRCVCRLPEGPSELEYVLLAGTPIGDLVDIDGAAQRAHWRYVRDQFMSVESVTAAKPMLVLAHIVVPHPPFVFDAEGSFASAGARFSMLDGTQFPGTRAEYIDGYGSQARYALARLEALFERLLARRRHPVIVVQSDHGSALDLVHSDITAQAWRERLQIFSAFAAPQGIALPPDDITPVNALRWAYSAATGTPWAVLPNHSYISTYARPYDFVEAPPEVVRPSD